jgi:AAA domain
MRDEYSELSGSFAEACQTADAKVHRTNGPFRDAPYDDAPPVTSLEDYGSELVIDPSATTSNIPSKFRPISIDDVKLSAEPAWAIHRLLPARGLSSTFGPPKCRKSFLMCDALFAVARGVLYAGREVLQGPVFYCTGEGISGFKRRLVAMRRHYGAEGQGVPFFMIENVPDLGSEKTNLHELLAEIDRCVQDNHLPAPRAIALDTVARCMGDGDENTARDMGRFVTRCGEIERRYSCLVAAVHHTGKDPSLGGRGSNALNGAADVTWKVERSDGFSTVTIEEIKDGPSGASWTFRLLPFGIGATKSATIGFEEKTDEIGSEGETCVVELITEPNFATKSATKPKRRLTGLAGDLFKVIKRAIDEAGDVNHNLVTAPRGVRSVSRETLKAYCVSMAWQDPEGNPHGFRTMLARHLSGLRAQEIIGFDREWLWLT